jgi:hypothetical protein
MTTTTQTTRLSWTARWATTAAVGVPFLVSLGLPAVTGSIDAPNTTAPGVEALMIGFVGNPIAWLANVLLPFGMVLFHKGRLRNAAIFGAAAMGCASVPLILPMGLALEVGYYVWLSSMAIFFVGSSMAWRGMMRKE